MTWYHVIISYHDAISWYDIMHKFTENMPVLCINSHTYTYIIPIHPNICRYYISERGVPRNGIFYPWARWGMGAGPAGPSFRRGLPGPGLARPGPAILRNEMCCFQHWHGFRSLRGARIDPSRWVSTDERIFKASSFTACRNIQIMLKNVDFGQVWGSDPPEI